MKFEIDTEKIEVLAKEADKLVLDPKAEKGLMTLFEMQEKIKVVIEEATKMIEAKALQLYPDFKRIDTDNLRITYRVFGNKYKINDNYIGELPEELYNTSIKHNANSKNIDALLEKTGKLPRGIEQPTRTKKLSISLKGTPENEE
jgi:hypothetical protein